MKIITEQKLQQAIDVLFAHGHSTVPQPRNHHLDTCRGCKAISTLRAVQEREGPKIVGCRQVMSAAEKRIAELEAQIVCVNR